MTAQPKVYKDIPSIPKDDSPQARKFCAEVGRRANIDAERLSVSETYITSELEPRRTIFIDGKPLDFVWSPELLQDQKALTGKDVEDQLIQDIAEALAAGNCIR